MIAYIQHHTCQRQPDNAEARDRHPHGKPSGRQSQLRNLDDRIGDDRHCGHRGEVMAADRER